jgi:hypothetical protein
MYLQYYFHALHCFVPLKCQILSDWNVMFLLWWAASAGLGFLQFCNLNSYRSMFIVGFSLFIGLSVPQYLHEYLTLFGHGPAHTRSTSVHIYLTQQVSSCYKYNHLSFLLWFSRNMQYNNIASDFLISSNCGNYSCLLIGFHYESWTRLNSPWQWETLVGKIQDLQSGYQKWWVLWIAYDSEHIFPFSLNALFYLFQKNNINFVDKSLFLISVKLFPIS